MAPADSNDFGRRMQAALRRAHEERAETLREFRDPTSPIALDGRPQLAVTMPEDGSYRVRQWRMTIDPNRTDDMALLRSAQAIGRREGFEVAADVPASQIAQMRAALGDDEAGELRIIQRTTNSNWTEDDREYAADGSVRMPARWLGNPNDVTTQLLAAQRDGRVCNVSEN